MARYDDPAPAFGQTMAGIYVKTHEQSMLLQEILEREMRERAGSSEEALLARWYNDLASIRREAERDSWTGWVDAKERKE